VNEQVLPAVSVIAGRTDFQPTYFAYGLV
jgi:hypothetical protein